MREAHAAQHVRRLRELDVVIPDDLDAVAPGIAEIKEAPGQHLDPGLRQRLAHRLFVIDDQAEMPAVIGGLPTAFLQGEELIAKIDESRVLALAPQLEFEQAAVERQCLFDVADLERDVIETNRARLLCFSHAGSPQSASSL